MNDSVKIKYFPKNNMKAYDGMSVTADVWEKSHNEHREMMRAHLLSMHKPGIICGLEIRANDPADHYVFITPGAAVDEMGRVIIVDQTIAYDFGDEGAGHYLLLVGYAEHENRCKAVAAETAGRGTGAAYDLQERRCDPGCCRPLPAAER